MSEGTITRATYFKVFGALMVLTAVTVGVAFLDLRIFNVVVAVTIAVVKATLVVLYFMHVKESEGLVKVTVVAGFFWFGILIALTLSDYFSRAWIPVGGR